MFPTQLALKGLNQVMYLEDPLHFEGWVVALGSEGMPKSSNDHIKGHIWGFCMGNDARFKNYELDNQVRLR
jgi:2-keto-4-pentenoate hydratase/2-oxohepta-3-ene-1,7-dioic acid hydratase in catechol pathway